MTPGTVCNISRCDTLKSISVPTEAHPIFLLGPTSTETNEINSEYHFFLLVIYSRFDCKVLPRLLSMEKEKL